MKHFIVAIGIIVGLSGVMSCSEPYVGCVDNGDCGAFEACIVNVCEPVECFENSDCGLEQRCNVATYECVSGCDLDVDCLAGQSCNMGECVEYGCRDTQLDCFIGDICNLDTGYCELADGDHCKPCAGSASQCGNTAACYTFEDGAQGGYCLESCQTTDDCPRGYSCGADASGSLICSAWCPLYDDLGLLPW